MAGRAEGRTDMRRKVETGYSRGEETRARILDVAVRMFGSHGFDGVSTREIAAAASVPQPSLRYYFESKQGLYVACLNHVQALTLQAVEPVIVEAERLLADDAASGFQMIDAFCSIQEAMIDHLIGGVEGSATALFMVRHDLPSVGGAHKFTGDGTIAYRLTACFTRLIMRISGSGLDGQAALLVAGLLNGPLTIIYIRRGRLADIGWDITPERLQWLRRTIRKHTTAALLVYLTE
ncbi:TetR/AcrR family transcriptional regulator [Sphingomonas solaris]|uniref:TetR family transcriptional regulator n=1 Tax=Alterirhizorhabdus solaris TaxID=2529389 RepID=A0A558R616_9SPHN|nr:TetR family transcriptional regulator [Sphingomonas solaris]TVV74762.1 TetR family transcriptional regulator [Sphingomonas solaris]